MRKLSLVVLLLSLLGLSSCLDIVEEVHFNRNGGGKYTLKLDMSGLFSDGFMKGMLEEALKSEDNPLKLNNGRMEQDTVIYMKNMPDSIRRRLERPEFWEKVSMRMTMSESKKTMVSTIELNFDKVADISYLFENLSEVGGNQGMGGGMFEGGSGMLGAGMFEWGAKALKRLPMAQKDIEGMDDDAMGMMEMFMGSSTYTTIYHLPGKVKKVSIPNAKVEGNTVTVAVPYLDILQNKAKLDGEIKFK